jgi:Uma2 family endonuclease
MAALPSTTLVTAEEYLNTSYRPDREYVVGVLVERSMPNVTHGLLLDLVSLSFGPYRKQFSFKTLHNTRTQIVELGRYRLPDLVLCPSPLPRGTVVNVTPWVVIEILSPEDKMADIVQRFREYKKIGTRHVLLLDPGHLIAYCFEDDSLIKSKLTELDLPTGSLPFDTDALFRQFTEERGE